MVGLASCWLHFALRIVGWSIFKPPTNITSLTCYSPTLECNLLLAFPPQPSPSRLCHALSQTTICAPTTSAGHAALKPTPREPWTAPRMATTSMTTRASTPNPPFHRPRALNMIPRHIQKPLLAQSRRAQKIRLKATVTNPRRHSSLALRAPQATLLPPRAVSRRPTCPPWRRQPLMALQIWPRTAKTLRPYALDSSSMPRQR